MRSFSVFLSYDGITWTECVTKQDVFTEIVKTQGALGDISDRMIPYSRTIKVLQTDGVNDLFNHSYNVATVEQKTELFARIESGTIDIMSGYARLLSVTEKEYIIAVYEKSKIEFDTSGLNLNELDWTSFETFYWNKDSIDDAWASTDEMQAVPMDTLCDAVKDATCGILKDYLSWTASLSLKKMVENVLSQLYPKLTVDTTGFDSFDKMYIALPMKQSIDSDYPDTVMTQNNVFDSPLITAVREVNEFGGGTWIYHFQVETGFGAIDNFTLNSTSPNHSILWQNTYWTRRDKSAYTFTGTRFQYELNFDIPIFKFKPSVSATLVPSGFATLYITDMADNVIVQVTTQPNDIEATVINGSGEYEIEFPPVTKLTNKIVNGEDYKISIRYFIDIADIGIYNFPPNTAPLAPSPTSFRMWSESSARLVVNEAYKHTNLRFQIKPFMPAKPCVTFIKDVLKMINARLVIEDSIIRIEKDKDKFTASYNVVNDWIEIKGEREINYDKARVRSLEIKYAQAQDPTTKIEYGTDGFGYKLIEAAPNTLGKDILIKLDLIALANFTNIQNFKYDGIDYRNSNDELLRACIRSELIIENNEYDFNGEKSVAPVFGVFDGESRNIDPFGQKLLNLNFGESNTRNTFSLPRMDITNMFSPDTYKYQTDSITLFSIYYENVVNSLNERGSKFLRTKFILSPEQFAQFKFSDKILIEGVLFEVEKLVYKVDNGETEADLVYLIPSPVVLPSVVVTPSVRERFSLADAIDGNRNSDNEFLLNAVNKQWLVVNGATNYTSINTMQEVDGNISR